jgi:hypothetical protein
MKGFGPRFLWRLKEPHDFASLLGEVGHAMRFEG